MLVSLATDERVRLELYRLRNGPGITCRFRAGDGSARVSRPRRERDRRSPGGSRDGRPVLHSIKGSFFGFSWGSRRPLWAARAVTLWIVPNGPGLLLTTDSSLSGIAFLSGPIWDRANRVAQACHLKRIASKTRPPNWPYRGFYRSPLSMPLETSVGAPSRGAKVCGAGGGRTDRWPQMTAIPLRAVLQGLRIIGNWTYQCDIWNP